MTFTANPSDAQTRVIAPPVAMVSMGEMGSALAARLVSRGVEVRTSVQGRAEATRIRAEQIGVRVCADDAELMAGAGFIFSIVPPEAAYGVAARFQDAFRTASAAPVFVDCNAISPQRMAEVAEVVSPTGARVADASILGLAPRGQSGSPRIYVSGPAAASLRCLLDKGLDFRLMPEKPIGAASALKCAYAAVAKSVAVIGAEAAQEAADAGVAGELRDELTRFQPGLWSSIERDFATFERKAYRWVGEMREIARFMSQVEGGATTFEGLAQTLEWIEQMRVRGTLGELEAWALQHASKGELR